MNVKKSNLNDKNIRGKRLLRSSVVIITLIIIIFICAHIVVEETGIYMKVFGEVGTRTYLWAFKILLTYVVVFPLVIIWILISFQLPIIVKLFLIFCAFNACLTFTAYLFLYVFPL